MLTSNWLEMRRVFKHIPTDGDIRAVVLYGKGRCFTAGLDRGLLLTSE